LGQQQVMLQGISGRGLRPGRRTQRWSSFLVAAVRVSNKKQQAAATVLFNTIQISHLEREIGHAVLQMSCCQILREACAELLGGT
jgi:hypothetical protein